MTFTISYKGALLQGSVAIHRFENQTDAKAWLESRTDPAIGGLVVSEPFDITGSKKFMVDLFNALAKEGDEQIGPNGFNTRATGQSRIFDRLTQYYLNLPATAVEQGATPPPTALESSSTEHQPEENDDMATKAKTKKATKAPRVKKEPVEKQPRELKKGMVFALKGYVLKNPNITVADLLDKLVNDGFKTTEGTVSSFRQDFIHSLKFLNLKGHAVPQPK